MSKSLLALVALVIASLQAWDSHALQAEAFVQVMILIGVVTPAIAIFVTRDVRVRGAAVLAAASLMVLARVVSDQAMPALALAALFPATLVLLDHTRTLSAQKNASLVDPRARE